MLSERTKAILEKPPYPISPQSTGSLKSIRGTSALTLSGYFCAAPVLKTSTRSFDLTFPCFIN